MRSKKYREKPNKQIKSRWTVITNLWSSNEQNKDCDDGVPSRHQNLISSSNH